MNKPIAVLISDVHYSVHTLKLADAAMRQAITKANDLDVPLIVAGDLHDTKANLRGECVNAMIDTFKRIKGQSFLLIGNHDKINEKSEEHSLNFLQPYTMIVNRPFSTFQGGRMLEFIPYAHDTAELKAHLKKCDKREILIMHQGLNGSNMGDYIKDDTALNKEDVAGRRIISGHYHCRQTIELSDGGKWDFIGNPYSLTYGEANDPPKGYQILYQDGSLEFVPTNLRKHVVLELNVLDDTLLNLIAPVDDVAPNDLVWVKVHASKEILQKATKVRVARHLGLLDSFKLELICTEEVQTGKTDLSLKSDKLLDSIIDSLSDVSDDRKNTLKSTWRQLCD